MCFYNYFSIPPSFFKKNDVIHFSIIAPFSLCNNAIGPRGVLYIAVLLNRGSFPELERLQLAHNPIGVAVPTEVEQWMKRRNDVQNTLTTSEDSEWIDKFLAPTPCEAMRAVSALCQLPKLFELDLSYCSMGDAELSTLAEGLKFEGINTYKRVCGE